MKKKKMQTKKRTKSRTRARSKSTAAKRTRRRPITATPESETNQLWPELNGASPIDSGGDLDVDWQRAQSTGEEIVGGSVATPDQDVVDDLARPLGVERPTDAPVITSDEILGARDRRRWRIEQAIDEQARDAEPTC